jgi:hypothetical protein
MDVLALIAIVAAAAAAGRAVGRVVVSNGGFGLGELFRTSHELGWPVGVQEDDGPVGWGAKVGAMSDVIAAEAESAVDSPLADTDELHATTEHVAPHARQAWRVVLHGGSMAAGSARR